MGRMRVALYSRASSDHIADGPFLLLLLLLLLVLSFTIPFSPLPRGVSLLNPTSFTFRKLFPSGLGHKYIPRYLSKEEITKKKKNSEINISPADLYCAERASHGESEMRRAIKTI